MTRDELLTLLLVERFGPIPPRPPRRNTWADDVNRETAAIIRRKKDLAATRDPEDNP